MKNHCVGLRPALPLAEARVTQLATASFRDNSLLNSQILDESKKLGSQNGHSEIGK